VELSGDEDTTEEEWDLVQSDNWAALQRARLAVRRELGVQN
jgi:hypothetical protein